MMIGYARVSTDEQKMDLQIAALKKAGCERIFCDNGVSGADMERSGLSAAIQAAKCGGTLVVWRLDRLGRSLSGLVQLIDEMSKQSTEFQSLTEAIDTRTSAGRLIFHIMAALAEFERSLISERTTAGLEAARARGASIGRPRALSDSQVSAAAQEISQRRGTITSVSRKFGVSRRTLQRYLHQRVN
ncbi:recombinase family protein [Roseobacter sp. HKCCD9010]|uniref:recombinase family protein n=1 Tax=unclassified Roseobacter TaxID=196798 RepID=UPI0014914562|nr:MULTISPECIES: recombinase family protein [unclassified Roseobacter]MBF9051729.1 recombinase family protein [Rhodobacterales bacterium HKCCD4356]NNV13722.1 recombinase family protein [Roseobacter sp. HKCCD7357]NNV17747.1 recombinase family protein [Roseobacter sp. HKCCD8768]NNV27354.1 recombinase family protein [Roseobacter sp. HKCCD8192]NNV31474.1 recombinase family protein [Roseobacter sp. HKCCD9061]